MLATLGSVVQANDAGFDVIGDVHGHVEQLEALLGQMGYTETKNGWKHSERTAVFVGDLIDRRRDHQLDTLRVVRKMVDEGAAKIVLGNHEFNAVAYSTVEDLDAAHLGERHQLPLVCVKRWVRRWVFPNLHA